MLKTIIYRMYPSKEQESRLFHYLQVTRQLYNHSLEQRIKYYKETGKTLTFFDQLLDLTELRRMSQVLDDVPLNILRSTLERLDNAYVAFFRRLKIKKGKAGFPRFKGSQRWNSFTMGSPGTVFRGTNQIRISRVSGKVRVRNPLRPEGKIKEQRIVYRAGKWFCQLVIDNGQPPPNLQPVKSSVGIDVGLKCFAVLSTGEEISNPRFHRKSERRLKRAQRRVSRKVKGSQNRRKAVKRLQRCYERITNLKTNFAHHLSKRVVSEHQLIAVEKLNIQSMVRNKRFAKSIADAAWGMFLRQLAYKAENAGCLCVAVDPKGTSQDCSGCGERVQKDVSVRVHDCPKCGLRLDRDRNAALNILQRAISAPAPGMGDGKARGEPGKPKRRRRLAWLRETGI